MLSKQLIQAAAGNAGGEVLGVEDVFSTWLYTGNSSTQTITNGIDLAGEGGMVWTKARTSNVNSWQHDLEDTSRGAGNYLQSNSTVQSQFNAQAITSFSSSGYSIGNITWLNNSSETYASWTFRKAPGFFDVVTYTGNGVNRTIAHNLGSVPGTIIVKRTDASADWQVYHRSLANTEYLVLNSTAAKATDTTRWNSTTPTSSVFSLGTDTTVNASGGTYVAYLFAHDAGGFGDSGNESVIKCGSFTTDGSGNATVNLGWEPQWLVVKDTTNVQNWYVEDSMRGFNLTSRAILFPNLSNAEATGTTAYLAPSSTGFSAVNGQLNASSTYIYIAIRRGPMKTPTDATKVFSANAFTSSSNGTTTTGFPPDLVLYANRDRTAFSNSRMADRLRGAITSGPGKTLDLMTESTSAEGAVVSNIVSTDNVSFKWQSGNAGYSIVSESFRRAPGFFDVVAYTGNGSATRTITHNLGVVPELVIIKSRSNSDATFSQWAVGGSVIQAAGANRNLFLNATDAVATGYNPWSSTLPTSTVFTVNNSALVNGNAQTYIAYLFATCPGVSKVGSYTGNGTTLSIDCGFTSGARFVLIKRTDSTGDWYVWDTARGIVSGNDPYLLLNSTAAEVTNTDYIDPLSSGFQISSTAPAAINANGGSYIFLAIA